MSDNWIAIIPRDPFFVPDESRRESALTHFHRIAPESDEISIKLSDHLQFFDCGSNLISVTCPSCDGEIEVEWWQDRMDEDYREKKFRLEKYITPCCSASVSLADLKYDWPQGFAKFGIDAMNPNIGELSDSQKAEFEELLGTKLMFIYQHI